MRTYRAGGAGGVLGLVVGGAGSMLAMLTPLPAAYPTDAAVVAQAATGSLGVAGPALGVIVSRLANRQAAAGPEADYLDGPPPPTA